MYGSPCGEDISLYCHFCCKEFASNEELEKHLKTSCLIIEAELKLKKFDESGEDGSISSRYSEDEDSSSFSSSNPKEDEEVEKKEKSVKEKNEEPKV